MLKYDNPKLERVNHIYYNNLPHLSRRIPDLSQFLKNEHKITNFTAWDYVIFTKDTIFMNDGSYSYLKILTLKKPQKIYSSFEKVRA